MTFSTTTLSTHYALIVTLSIMSIIMTLNINETKSYYYDAECRYDECQGADVFACNSFLLKSTFMCRAAIKGQFPGFTASQIISAFIELCSH